MNVWCTANNALSFEDNMCLTYFTQQISVQIHRDRHRQSSWKGIPPNFNDTCFFLSNKSRNMRNKRFSTPITKSSRLSLNVNVLSFTALPTECNNNSTVGISASSLEVITFRLFLKHHLKTQASEAANHTKAKCLYCSPYFRVCNLCTTDDERTNTAAWYLHQLFISSLMVRLHKFVSLLFTEAFLIIDIGQSAYQFQFSISKKLT